MSGEQANAALVLQLAETVSILAGQVGQLGREVGDLQGRVRDLESRGGGNGWPAGWYDRRPD
jgi:hypothetical protein